MASFEHLTQGSELNQKNNSLDIDNSIQLKLTGFLDFKQL